jgi:hypothetical protein
LHNKNNIPETHRIKIEQKTIDKMIHIYCRDSHSSAGSLCDECSELYEYAFRRLLNCPYQEDKPVCSECPIHCYNQEMRLRIKTVMKYAGPKMIFRHPYLAIMHLLNEKFYFAPSEE